jgi:hypothetical protein
MSVVDENSAESEEEEKRRFEIELEFVQTLADPGYLSCMSALMPQHSSPLCTRKMFRPSCSVIRLACFLGSIIFCT